MSTMTLQEPARRFEELLGHGAVITDPVRLRTYECDGLTHHRVMPGIVVLPETAEQIAAVVRVCNEYGLPFVARGAGTGLSGGALPRADGVLIVTSKMRRILSVDLANRRAVVEPGVTNLAITEAVARPGLLLRARPVQPAGLHHRRQRGGELRRRALPEVRLHGQPRARPGDRHPRRRHRRAAADSDPGYDLLGAFVGSEGTLGIATKVTVRLTRAPETVTTLLAAFKDIEQGGQAVSAVIGGGIVPAAIEMMDALAIEAAEAAVACAYPEGAGAVLIVELDGPAEEVAHQFGEVTRICEESGAFELRIADDPAERAAIWKGRKSAFAAVGRISPAYIVQDGVVPRTALPEVLASIDRLSREHGIRVANVFHAGDGNLHPLVLFDDAEPGAGERAEIVVGEDPRPLHRARRIDHRRARRRRGQVPIHVEDVLRRGSRHHAAGALRLRPPGPVEPRQDLPHPAPVR